MVLIGMFDSPYVRRVPWAGFPRSYSTAARCSPSRRRFWIISTNASGRGAPCCPRTDTVDVTRCN